MKPKTTKVYYMGKRLKDMYPHATKWQVFKYKVRKFFHKVFVTLAVVGILYGAVQIGAEMFPKVVYAVQEKAEEPIPVMERIAKCESDKQHKENGQVLLRGNKNKTVDVGIYQINSVWFKKATELGYDLTTREGNTAMAMWIYHNRGTSDWSASYKCWK